MLDTLKGKYRNYEVKASQAAIEKITWTVFKVVFFRVTSILLLLGSAILLTVALILRPWKIEYEAERPVLIYEISIWEVCRKAPPGWKCFEGELDGAPSWFHAMRWLLIIATVQQYVSCFFCIIMVLIRRNNESRFFWIPSFICLSSAAMLLTAMVLYIAFFDFGFLEESRKVRMGWREDPDVEEESKWPPYAGYSSIGVTLFSFLYLMGAFFVDERFTQNYDSMKSKSRIGY